MFLALFGEKTCRKVFYVHKPAVVAYKKNENISTWISVNSKSEGRSILVDVSLVLLDQVMVQLWKERKTFFPEKDMLLVGFFIA